MGAVAVPVYGISDEGDFEIHMDRIGKELQCRICMAAYDEATMTLCDHYFCKACITAAIAARKQCPLCKAPVTRRELRVDERMCAFVKTYRRILASHRMKNTYCSQLPASQTAQTQKSSQLKISRNKTTELTPQTRRKSTVDCEGMPPPPARGHGDSPVTSQKGHGNAGGSAQKRKRRAARDAPDRMKTMKTTTTKTKTSAATPRDVFASPSRPIRVVGVLGNVATLFGGVRGRWCTVCSCKSDASTSDSKTYFLVLTKTNAASGPIRHP